MGFFDKIEKKAHTRMPMEVCMLGARGVGKTSIMASIFCEARKREGLASTKVCLKAKPETLKELSTRANDIEAVFDDRTNIAAIPATSGIHSFNFEMGLIGRTPCVDLDFVDYPGEKLENDSRFVADQIKKSSAVLVVIDAPFLMEEDGKYCEEKNQVALVSKFLKENVNALSNKLIMFVPLKCEKYLDIKTTPFALRKDRTDEMFNKITEVYYKEIIEFLKTKQNIAVVVAPILTMGGVTFDKFGYDAYENRRSEHYKFYDGHTLDGKNAKYSPVFCVQPILYLLSFAAKQYEIHKNNVGFIDSILQTIVGFFKKNSDFFNEMTTLNTKRITTDNGYAILNGKELFYSKQ